MATNKYRTVRYEESFEKDCAKIEPDPRKMDDHVSAAEIMAQRGLAKDLAIPRIPNTHVFVFRLEPAGSFPATRWFFKAEGDDLAVFVAVEAIDDENDEDEPSE